MNLHSLQKAYVVYIYSFVDYQTTKHHPLSPPPTIRRQAQQLNYVTVNHVVVVLLLRVPASLVVPLPSPFHFLIIPFCSSFFSLRILLCVEAHAHIHTLVAHTHILGLHKRELALFPRRLHYKNMQFGDGAAVMFTKSFALTPNWLFCM